MAYGDISVQGLKDRLSRPQVTHVHFFFFYEKVYGIFAETSYSLQL